MHFETVYCHLTFFSRLITSKVLTLFLCKHFRKLFELIETLLIINDTFYSSQPNTHLLVALNVFFNDAGGHERSVETLSQIIANYRCLNSGIWFKSCHKERFRVLRFFFIFTWPDPGLYSLKWSLALSKDHKRLVWVSEWVSEYFIYPWIIE